MSRNSTKTPLSRCRYDDLYHRARKLIQHNTEIEDAQCIVHKKNPVVPSFEHLTTHKDKNGDKATGFTHFYLDQCLNVDFEESRAKPRVITELIDIDFEMYQKPDDKANFIAKIIYSCCFKAPFKKFIDIVLNHPLASGLDDRTKFKSILGYQSHDKTTCLNVLFDLLAKVRNKYGEPSDEASQKIHEQSSEQVLLIAEYFIRKSDQYLGTTTTSKLLVKGQFVQFFNGRT